MMSRAAQTHLAGQIFSFLSRPNNLYRFFVPKYLKYLKDSHQIDFGTVFCQKNGDIGTLINKIKLFVVIWISTAYNEQDVTICKQP